MKISISIAQARRAIAANVACGIATLLRGQPGLGKTEGAESVYEQLKAKFLGGFFVFSTTEYNALDLGGLYSVQDGKTVRCPIGTLPLDKPVFILIDEFADCPAHEQSGWYRLLKSKMLGEAKLHPGSYVMAACNRPEDNASANELSMAAIGRCSVIDVDADWEATVSYGSDNGWNQTVLWFLRAFGREVINAGFDPNCSFGGSTPRDFEHVSRMENAGVISKKDNKLSTMQVVSKLGPKTGLKYHAFRAMPVPDVTPVFKTPTTADIPRAVDEQCIFAAAVIGAATPANFDAIATYALRCDRVMGFGMCYDLARKLPEFKKTPAFAKCALAFIDLV